MLLKISEYVTNSFVNKKIINSDSADIYIYGFQLTFSTLFSIITILLISSLINFLFGIIFLCFFMPLRFCAGGYHSKTYWNCFILTNLSFILVLFVSALSSAHYIYSIFFLVCLLSLWFKAPCINKNNPLSDKYIKKNRIYTRIILTIDFFFLFVLDHFDPFAFILGTNTIYLVFILFAIGKLENKKANTKITGQN